VKQDFARARQQAISLYSSGKLHEALRLCERLNSQADDAAVSCLAGIIYGQLGQFGNSAAFCRKALELSPDYVDAESCLGYALRRLNDLQGARKAFKNVIRKTPENPYTHYQLGLTLESEGDFEAAIESYRTAQRLNPGYLDAYAGVASVYDKLGAFKQAYQAIRKYTEPVLGNTQIAVLYGRLARKLSLDDRPVEKIERFLENKALPAEDRLQVHFVLGELLDALGEYDRAFSHIARANTLKSARFDPDQFSRQVDGLISQFSRSALGNAARATHASDRQIFIVGMPRSGTTLVEQILSSHPAVYGAGELTHLSVIATSLAQRRTDIVHLDRRELDRIANTYLESVRTLDSTSLRVVDKLPNNFLRLGYIELLFPGARIIHCRRNPLDTCLSCYFRNFSHSLPETFDLEHIGRYYIDYRRIMQHWNEVISLPVLELDYETLVADPENQIRRLVESTGLPWDENCLDFKNNRRIAKTASYDQVRQPLYSSSVGHWCNYERHLAPLIRLLRDAGVATGDAANC